MLFALLLPIPARVIAPVPSPALILIVPNALVAPIAPPTPIAPAFVSNIKLNGPLPSSLIVELKSIDPLLASVLICTLAVNIAGPLMSTLLPAASAVVILPPKLIEVAAVKVTFSISVATVPPRTIVPPSVPVEAPATMVTVSALVLSSTPFIFPETVIVSLLVVATTSKSPVILRSPEV